MLYTEKSQIIDWLDSHRVKSYTLVPDANYGYLVNAQHDVDLTHENITEIKVKFGHVRANFFIYNNPLISLLGSPDTVGGSFVCSQCQLTSLKYAPQSVGGSFSCSENLLTSLVGGPQYVGDVYNCCNNQLNTLEFFPEAVDSNKFHLSNNPGIDQILKNADNYQFDKSYAPPEFMREIKDFEKLKAKLEKEKLNSQITTTNTTKTYKI